MKIRFSRVNAMDQSTSKRVIEKLYEQRPDLKHNRINLLKLRLEENQIEIADEITQSLLSEYTNDLKLIYNLSKLYSAANHFENALLLFNHQPNEKLPILHLIRKIELLSITNSNPSDYKESVALLLNTNSTRHEVLSCQAKVYYRQKEFHKSVAICNQILKKHPRDVQTLHLLSNCKYSMGDKEGALEIIDIENLIGVYSLRPNKGVRASLNKALQEELNKNNTWLLNPLSYTVTNGEQLDRLSSYNRQIFTKLEERVSQKVVEYISSVSNTRHTYFRNLPENLNLKINSWAVRLFKGGHQAPHIHANGWISGVYYVQTPVRSKKKSKEGAIEFGIQDQDHNFNALHLIHPEEGMLLLFPSYILHRTVPFESDQSRVCISFDFSPIDD